MSLRRSFVEIVAWTAMGVVAVTASACVTTRSSPAARGAVVGGVVGATAGALLSPFIRAHRSLFEERGAA